jgi:hypothetical protein
MAVIRMADPISTLLDSEETLPVLLPTVHVGSLVRLINRILINIRKFNENRLSNNGHVTTDNIKEYLDAINDIMNTLEKQAIIDNICIFLGNEKSELTSCKIKDTLHPKLLKFSNIIKTLILEYLRGIDNEILKHLQSDENTMKQLTETIRSLIYFFGTKTIYPILSYFSDFYNELNNLFGNDIIVINCPYVSESNYTCGRMVAMIHCEETKKYRILIGRTEGMSSNMESTNSYIRGDKTLSEQCGGKRKTRKTKKHYKRSVKRKQSKRR